MVAAAPANANVNAVTIGRRSVTNPNLAYCRAADETDRL